MTLRTADLGKGKRGLLTTEASISFGRKIAINYQSYDYASSMTQEISGNNWDEINLKRDLLRYRVRQTVYRDIWEDLDVLLEKVLQYVNQSSPMYALLQAQAKSLKEEAQIMFEESVIKVSELEAKVGAIEKEVPA